MIEYTMRHVRLREYDSGWREVARSRSWDRDYWTPIFLTRVDSEAVECFIHELRLPGLVADRLVTRSLHDV